MAKYNTQGQSLEIVNKVARYLHFDPRARQKIHTIDTIAQNIGIPYTSVQNVMRKNTFESMFMRDPLGSIILSGDMPDFMRDKIDFDTPYVPVYRCDDPNHTTATRSVATPHIKSQPKKHNADYIDPKIVRKYLSPERMQDFRDMLNRNYHKPTGKDDPYWEWVNLANTLSVVLALLINKDPEAKLAELIDKPEVFNEKAPNLVKGIKTAYEETKNV